ANARLATAFPRFDCDVFLIIHIAFRGDYISICNKLKNFMTTPLRRQYLEIKRRYPGMILFFQIGDFYESFDEDAHVVARELGVALTRKYFGKGQMHPLAGVPVRSIEGHLAKLINRGYKVAVCDQVTPPGKGLVEREVTRIVTPGTVVEPGLLE